MHFREYDASVAENQLAGFLLLEFKMVSELSLPLLIQLYSALKVRDLRDGWNPP